MAELVWGLKNGDIDQVKDIIESSKCDVNKEIEGRPLLHYAADYGQSHVIEYLISKGANINVVDKHGITALLAAVWEGHTECVRLLLSKGADRSVKAPDGTSLVESADKEEIRQLLKN